MPFIDMGDQFGDTKEAELAPEGKEYDLLCKEIEELEKDGKKTIRVMILVEDPEEDYAPFSHFLSLPNPEKDQQNDEAKGHSPGTTGRTKMLMIKRFLHAFRVPFDSRGFDPQDIIGARARLPLTQEVNQQEGPYKGRRNQRLVLPSLPSESTSGEGQEKASKKKAKTS